MATIVNDKDKILQAAAVRLPAVLGNGIYFSTPAPVFKVTAAGVSTPANYAITAKFLGQITGTVTWSIVSGTVATTGQSGNTWTITPAQLTTDSAVIRATLTYLGTTYTSDVTVSKVLDGSSAVAVSLSNENFTFTASSTGTVSSYTGSGTTIRVYEGSVELTYDGVGTANSTWTVTSVATGITKGTIVDSGTYATAGNASAMPDATDIASITYTITGKTSAGVSFNLTKTQNFSKSKTGATGAGTNGANGLSSLTAYKAQDQSTAAPTFTVTTTGSVAPTGWTLTAPSVTVGQVLWYINGRYNSSTTTIDGVTSGTTAWTGPVAASIFQDIRSDNWNGNLSTSNYGTTGYYIRRSDGSAFFNGDARFGGTKGSGLTVNINGTSRSIDYTTYAKNNLATSTIVGVGHLGTAASATAQFNIGLLGIGTYASQGIGVMGSGDLFGGYFTGPTGISLRATGTTNRAIEIQGTGTFIWNTYNIPAPTGSTVAFLRNDGTWATNILTLANTNSGTATVSGSGLNLNGSTSTGIAGAYVATAGSGNTVTWAIQTTSPSDVRLKSDILDADLGLAFVNNLRPVSYKLKADPKQQKGYGFIAQEVEALIGNQSSLVYFEPDWQVGEETGFNTIHYPSYIAVLTKAIQELSTKVAVLEQQLQSITK